MSSELMRNAANVFEKLADVFDADEHIRTQQLQTERRRLAQQIGTKYAEVTGEDLSLEAIEKIASSDQDLVAVFQKLAERGPTSEAPEGMGAATDIADDGDKAPSPTNARYQSSREKHAAAEDADARFLNWINS
jgi:hypothetical protein